MSTVFKVNQNRKETVGKVADILNSCDMLLQLEVEDMTNKYAFHLQTDKVSIQYTETKLNNMILFLNELKEKVTNKDDIEELIEEVRFIH